MRAYATAASSERRICSGIVTSFPSPLIEASIVRAVTPGTYTAPPPLVLLSPTVLAEQAWRQGYGRRRIPVFISHGRRDTVELALP